VAQLELSLMATLLVINRLAAAPECIDAA
jgi:hypothetical protein